MRKIVFPINITIDGFADHTAVIADSELHDFFTDLLESTDTVLLGRKTYEMMASYWPFADKDLSSTESELRFAEKYNGISKIVFSKTLKKVEWNNSVLAEESLINVALKLKQQEEKNISAGSLSIASELMNEELVDECWFLIHPVIIGEGKKLLEGINKKINLMLVESKNFSSGAVMAHYEVAYSR